MNTEVATQEFNKKTATLIKELIPAAHYESLQLHITENNKLKREYKDLEKDMMDLRSDNVNIQNELDGYKSKSDEVSKRLSDIERIELELNTREATISKREAVRDHEVEIAQIKLDCADQKTDILKQTMTTVFKPAALRTEIQKSIPLVQNLYREEYNSELNRNEKIPDGHTIINESGSESKTEHKE